MAKKKPFPLRIDPDLYEDLRRWADAELRSVNGQIEYLLREAVDRRRGQPRGGVRASGTNTAEGRAGASAKGRTKGGEEGK